MIQVFLRRIILNNNDIEDITWPLGDTNFIFSCWKYLSLVRLAHSWEILSALEDKICIPKRPCNVLLLYILILMESLDLKQLVLPIFKRMKKWSPTAKTRMLCNMKQDMKVMKTNHVNVKFCNKNVNLVEKNYIKVQKYLTMKRKLAFYWLIVFVSMWKIKMICSLRAVKIWFFSKRRNPWISSVSI